VSPWFYFCTLRSGLPFFLVSLTLNAPALADPLPADCPTAPEPPGATMPLTVTPRLPAGPGMPQGGYAQFSLNVPTNGTTCQTAAPELPRDILHGDSSTDILTGQPTGRVIIERQ